MMRHGEWSGSGWLLMGLGMLLFWTLVAVLVLWLAGVFGRGRPDQSSPRPAGPDALGVLDARAILDRRLATGELSEDEYRSRRDLLDAR